MIGAHYPRNGDWGGAAESPVVQALTAQVKEGGAMTQESSIRSIRNDGFGLQLMDGSRWEVSAGDISMCKC